MIFPFYFNKQKHIRHLPQLHLDTFRRVRDLKKKISKIPGNVHCFIFLKGRENNLKTSNAQFIENYYPISCCIQHTDVALKSGSGSGSDDYSDPARQDRQSMIGILAEFMVLISDGNLEIGAHARLKLCSRHLSTQRAVKHRIVCSEKTHFRSCVRNML